MMENKAQEAAEHLRTAADEITTAIECVVDVDLSDDEIERLYARLKDARWYLDAIGGYLDAATYGAGDDERAAWRRQRLDDLRRPFGDLE